MLRLHSFFGFISNLNIGLLLSILIESLSTLKVVGLHILIPTYLRQLEPIFKMMRLENEYDDSESWASINSVENSSEMKDLYAGGPCQYRNPRLKLLGSVWTLAWGSFGFLLTILESVENNGDGVVPLSNLVWWSFAIVYAVTILIALVRIVAICQIRFLERRPNHMLGLPKGLFLCIYIVLAATTIAASFLFFRLRLSDQVPHISWSCFLYSWLVVLIAAWNLFRRFICCPNPVEACRQGIIRRLGTTYQRAESEASELAVDVVEGLFAHAGKVSYNNFFDVMVLLRAYQHRLRKSYRPNRDLVVVESQSCFVEDDVSYYKQYANAAYDYSLGYTSKSMILLIRRLYSKEAFARKTSIVNRVVLLASSENKTRKPVFFVAVDHDKRSLVISISGTAHITDICTDMEAVSVPIDEFGYPGSFAHSGILNAALTIEKETFATKDVELFLREHRDYEIITTGHSLGAGVASLLVSNTRTNAKVAIVR